MNTAQYILECRDLGRELPETGQRWLVQNINFSMQQAEVIAVVGPSGAGKSTLLRLLNRLDEPTHGSVCLHGRDYLEIPVIHLRRSVGMVMQRAYLFPGSVAENIAFGPAQQDRAMTSQQIDELLAHVGLEGYASRDVATMQLLSSVMVAAISRLSSQKKSLRQTA